MPHNPLFTRPRFFRDVTFSRHTARSIQWLELFYDLVYVATLIQIGNFLSDNVSIVGFGQFVVLMIVIWWAWTGETFYQNRYVSDDLLHRGIVFLQIFAIASFGLSVSQAFGPLYIQFTIAYVLIRLGLIVMYLRAMQVHPESRSLSQGYAVGFSLGVLVWIGSLLLPSDLHWAGWLVGIVIELGVPLVPHMRRLQVQHPFDPHHIAERFGIFTLIVLGEAFVKILDDAQGATITLAVLGFSTVGLLVTYALWWLYYSDTIDRGIDTTSPRKIIFWLYSHLPLVISLVTFGVAAKKVFAAATEHPGEPLKLEYRLLYTAALVLYLIAMMLIEYGTRNVQWRRIGLRLVSSILILLIGLFATGLDATGFVGVMAVVMLIQVAETILLPHSVPEAEHHSE